MLVRWWHAVGALQRGLTLGGEERGEPGWQWWDEVYCVPTKGLRNRVRGMEMCQFLGRYKGFHLISAQLGLFRTCLPGR